MQGVIGSKTIIQPFCYDDVAAYVHAYVPQVRALLRVPTLDHEYRYLMWRLAAHYYHQTFLYAVTDRITHAFIGCIEVRDQREFAGQLYAWLHPRWWSANYFQEAMHNVARDYFSKSSATTITAHVDVSNRRSWRALHKAGFVHTKRIVGPYEDQYAMTLFNRY